MTFEGFPRQQGRAGVRNHMVILSINGLANRAAERIAAVVRGTLLVTTPNGRGQYGQDKSLQRRQLIGLATNPNVAAVLVIGVDRKSADDIAREIASTGRAVEALTLDDTHEDALALSARGQRMAGHLLKAMSRQRRITCSVKDLFIGVECGHSDATSGIVANPLVGACVDRLVDLGASAVIGETLEWLGAEDIVAARARDAACAQAIRDAVLRRERDLTASGIDLTGNNPGAENIRGGLSTIEEKSLGAIAKTGTRPISGLLDHAAAPKGPGLFLMDGPSFSPESLTGFAAAGAQLTLFTTGPGNSFCGAVAPTVKLTGHPDTASRLPEQIDFDAAPVFRGEESIAAAADRLLDHLLNVASGELTFGEIFSEGAETLFRAGPSM